MGNEKLIILAEAALLFGPDYDSNIVDDNSRSIKPKRKRASPWQLSVLQRFYQSNPFPDNNERQILAMELQMSPRAVQIWFQNKRQTDKMKKCKVKMYFN